MTNGSDVADFQAPRQGSQPCQESSPHQAQDAVLLAVSHSPSRNPGSRISKKWRDNLEMNKAGILKEPEDGERRCGAMASSVVHKPL